ncbi:hypothetical protein WDU94_002422 [Cyamophila willieti]
MDVFEAAIKACDDTAGILQYTLSLAMSSVQSRSFRADILRTLVKLYHSLSIPDYVSMAQCWIYLDDPDSVAGLLSKLVSDGRSRDDELMAAQIGFDLYESATQGFLARVLQKLKTFAPIPSATHVIVKVPVEGSTSTPVPATPAAAAGPTETSTTEEETNTPPSSEKTVDSLNDKEKALQSRISKLSKILSGEVSIDLHLQFLIRSNKTDMLILKNTKESIRVSICHTATIIANAFMHSGTTSDQFLRDNLEWLARATNWAKLTATASLGVIHRGHEQEALAHMQSYLPRETGPTSGYYEGGGLYALGLIHANHGAVINDYLLGQLKDATNEMVKHGGCLGLGLAAMGSMRDDIYEQLKFNLYQDDAVTGEAAGIAMGLVLLGSKSDSAIQDMVAYAKETQHEKILRGLAVGISFIMYGQLENADDLVRDLCEEKDAILRRSGMYTIAMAYCGSGSTAATKRSIPLSILFTGCYSSSSGMYTIAMAYCVVVALPLPNVLFHCLFYSQDAILRRSGMSLSLWRTVVVVALRYQTFYSIVYSIHRMLFFVAVACTLSLWRTVVALLLPNVLFHCLFYSQDAILRRSGMYTIAMAYCGSGSTAATKRSIPLSILFTGCYSSSQWHVHYRYGVLW